MATNQNQGAVREASSCAGSGISGLSEMNTRSCSFRALPRILHAQRRPTIERKLIRFAWSVFEENFLRVQCMSVFVRHTAMKSRSRSRGRTIFFIRELYIVCLVKSKLLATSNRSSIDAFSNSTGIEFFNSSCFD